MGKMKENRVLIKVLDNGTRKYEVTPDPVCPRSDRGHDFNPYNGAPFGDNGACCVHCGAFDGVEYEELPV